MFPEILSKTQIDPIEHEKKIREVFAERDPDLPDDLEIFLYNINKLPDLAHRKRLIEDLIIPKLQSMVDRHYTKNLTDMPFVLSSITKVLNNDNSVAKDFIYNDVDPKSVHEFMNAWKKKKRVRNVIDGGHYADYHTPLWGLLDALGDDDSKKEYISHFLTQSEPDDYSDFAKRVSADHEPELAPLFEDHFVKPGYLPDLDSVSDFIGYHPDVEQVSPAIQDLFSQKLKEHIEKEGDLSSWFDKLSHIPKKLRDKHIDDFLQHIPRIGKFLTYNRGGEFYQDYKDKIDNAIAKSPPSTWKKQDASSVVTLFPEIAHSHIESFLDHPDAIEFWHEFEHVGNVIPKVGQKKADLLLKEVDNQRGFTSPDTARKISLLPLGQQKRIAQEAFSGKPYAFPVQYGDIVGPFLRAVAPHINDFSPDERSRFSDYLDRLVSNDISQHALLTSIAEGGFKGLENIEEYLDQKMPKLKLFGPANFWHDYELDVEPHHFAVGKSLVTGKPETIVDHRGDTGDSHKHFHLLDLLKNYAKATQDKIKERIADGSLKAKDIDGKPHVWLYRGVAGNFAQAIRNGIGAGKHDPNDHTVVDAQRASYPASHYESWSTSFNIARSFANRRIGGHPQGKGVIFGEWVPVDSIAHSGFIDVFPGQKHAHEKENEFVAHMNSETPVREFDPQSIHLDDGNGKYLPAKPAPTTAVEPPTESPMSKAEKPMDQKPNAHEILSVLHGEARKNKAQDSQQTIVDQNAQIKQRIHAVASKIKEVAPQLEQLKTTHPEAFSTLMESIKAMMTMAKQYVPQEAQKPTEPMQKARIEVRHPPGVRSPSMITGASADAKPTHRSGKIFTMEPDQTGEVKKKKREARSGLITNPANGAAVSVRQAPHEQKHPDAVKVT